MTIWQRCRLLASIGRQFVSDRLLMASVLDDRVKSHLGHSFSEKARNTELDSLNQWNNLFSEFSVV